jgi:hypothetical protein
MWLLPGARPRGRGPRSCPHRPRTPSVACAPHELSAPGPQSAEAAAARRESTWRTGCHRAQWRRDHAQAACGRSARTPPSSCRGSCLWWADPCGRRSSTTSPTSARGPPAAPGPAPPSGSRRGRRRGRCGRGGRRCRMPKPRDIEKVPSGSAEISRLQNQRSIAAEQGGLGTGITYTVQY